MIIISQPGGGSTSRRVQFSLNRLGSSNALACDCAWLTNLPSTLEKIRERFGSSEEEPEAENLVEREPNPLKGEVFSHLGLTISELVDAISQERGISSVDVSRGLYRAQEDDRVNIVDPAPPRSIIGFFSPLYNAWFWLVLVSVGLMIFSIFLTPQIYPLYYLRIGAGAIFLLIVPGYTMIEALYPRAHDLEKLERFGLSVGLSLAVVPIVGLVLNYTPWGIRLNPALVALSILTLVFAVVAVYRKYGYWHLTRSA